MINFAFSNTGFNEFLDALVFSNSKMLFLLEISKENIFYGFQATHVLKLEAIVRLFLFFIKNIGKRKPFSSGKKSRKMALSRKEHKPKVAFD